MAGTPAGRLPANPLTAPKALVAVTVPNRKLPNGVVAERALKAPAAVVSPYLYTQIVWGVFFGYVIFGDIPDLALVIGCVMIISSGLALLMLEQKTEA